jgi:hypothetical protein
LSLNKKRRIIRLACFVEFICFDLRAQHEKQAVNMFFSNIVIVIYLCIFAAV